MKNFLIEENSGKQKDKMHKNATLEQYQAVKEKLAKVGMSIKRNLDTEEYQVYPKGDEPSGDSTYFTHKLTVSDLEDALRTGLDMAKRIKPRQNPTDDDLIKKINIKRTKIGDKIIYNVYLGSSEIGYVEIYKGDDFVDLANISPSFRRKGVATYVYDYIENDLGVKLKPSDRQLQSHADFWKNRLKPRQNPKCKKIEVKRKIRILGKPRVIKVKRKVCNPELDLARLKRLLNSELSQYDQRLQARQPNNHRLAIYFEASDKAFTNLDSDSTLEDVKQAICRRFDPELPPVKKFLKKYV